ncbi:MAG: tetratricopeptide repeat protein [Candidatus Aminicenantes bacterium]|nr:MAG: tetratricopeptide repeat protein [Candidatus Aminicenantes bacterium]
MKKVLLVILSLGLVVLPCLFGQTKADREVKRTQDFIAATTQKGTAKINALKAYIKEFPETTSRWTRLAHYHLAIGYFELKDYGKSVEYANKTLKIGSLEPGEEGRLLLVIANCYGVKSASIFNQDKAVQYADKAISFSQSHQLNDVLAEAKKLKRQLSGPPPKKVTPEQQIKMHYSDGDFAAAISYYQKLGAADKANPEIHKTYANALFKANRLDSALKEFKALYSKEKKAIFALRIADVYAKKAQRNKALYDSAVNYYLEASVLYGKEGNANNQKIAYQKAEFQLFEKYGFNQKVKALAAQQKKSQASAEKNASQIRRAKYELRKLQRQIEREYPDIDPPSYMTDKVKELQKKIAALESGVTSEATDEAAKLEEEKKRIQQELKDLLAKVKKQLGA